MKLHLSLLREISHPEKCTTVCILHGNIGTKTRTITITVTDIYTLWTWYKVTKQDTAKLSEDKLTKKENSGIKRIQSCCIEFFCLKKEYIYTLSSTFKFRALSLTRDPYKSSPNNTVRTIISHINLVCQFRQETLTNRLTQRLLNPEIRIIEKRFKTVE